jgi:FkbM family methyltransferase
VSYCVPTEHPGSIEAAESPKERIEALGRRVRRLHRSILAPATLRGLLPLRAATLGYRSALGESRDRDARFRATSPAYVRALADAAAFAGETRVVDLDTLRWWVPLLHPDDEALVQRYLTHQDFPYRAIAQTREAGIGGIMLDVGANTGRMSIPRVILGDVTAAYCAEPDPLNYACLVRNVRDNQLTGLVLPDNVAVGAENGTVRLQRASSAGGHRVVDAGARTKRASVEVPSVTLDSWVARLGVDPRAVSFVKVDAQGSEFHILNGASNLLTFGHIAWQIEVDVPLLSRRGCSSDDLFTVFRRSFTHFVDLNRRAAGPRLRSVADLEAALTYITAPPGGRTDVLLFNLQAPASTAAEAR